MVTYIHHLYSVNQIFNKNYVIVYFYHLQTYYLHEPHIEKQYIYVGI